MDANAHHIVRRIDAVWQGIAADASFVELWKLHEGLRDAPTVLQGYAKAYHDVVRNVRDLERQAGDVLFELVDWAVIAATLATSKVPGILTLGWKALPPVDLIQTVTRVYTLWDIVKLAGQAIWDFEARVELGMLNLPGRASVPMPSVPSGSGVRYHE